MVDRRGVVGRYVRLIAGVWSEGGNLSGLVEPAFIVAAVTI